MDFRVQVHPASIFVIIGHAVMWYLAMTCRRMLVLCQWRSMSFLLAESISSNSFEIGELLHCNNEEANLPLHVDIYT